MSTFDLKGPIDKSKILGNLIATFSSVSVGTSSSKSNPRGIKTVKWFDESKIDISKNGRDVEMQVTRKGKLPQSVQLFDLFAESADWIKIMLQTMNVDINAITKPIKFELYRVNDLHDHQLKINEKLNDKLSEMTKVMEENLDMIASKDSLINKLTFKFNILKKISAVLAVTTILTVSYTVLLMNTEGFSSLI